MFFFLLVAGFIWHILLYVVCIIKQLDGLEYILSGALGQDVSLRWVLSRLILNHTPNRY